MKGAAFLIDHLWVKVRILIIWKTHLYKMILRNLIFVFTDYIQNMSTNTDKQVIITDYCFKHI